MWAKIGEIRIFGKIRWLTNIYRSPDMRRRSVDYISTVVIQDLSPAFDLGFGISTRINIAKDYIRSTSKIPNFPSLLSTLS